MNRSTSSAIPTRMERALRRTVYAAGLSLALVGCPQAYAGCQYIIDSDWGNGFAGKIRITNDGAAPINGWTVSWQYSGDNRMTSNYNAVFSGTNPYTASNLGWNATIQPNQSVEFGVQGTKGSGAAEIPVVTGAACGSATSSSAPSSVAPSSAAPSSVAPSSSAPSSVAPSSSAPSSVAPSSSSRSSSSAATTAAWTLDTTASYLNFVTAKNTHNVEVHGFTGLSGDISAAGVATLTIDLATVSTGIDIRNQRMRDLLFETATYPTATITVAVPANAISSLAVGQSSATDISASLNLHGVTGTITTKVSIQKLSANRVLVQSLSPILIKAGDYALTDGVEALRAIAGLGSISVAVPVDFALVFDAR